MENRTMEALRATYDKTPAALLEQFANEDRIAKYRPAIRHERFDEACKANGLASESKRIALRCVVEQWMANFDEAVDGRYKEEHLEAARVVVPMLRKRGELEGLHTEAGTGTSDIETFRSFLHGVIADVGPILAPVAELIGMVPMPGPSTKIAFLKAYGEENTTYYTSPFRLRDNVSTAFTDYTCGNRPSDIKFTVDTENITALAYAIISEINLCADQDARSQYGLDLHAEARKVIAYYLARTMVRRILVALKGAATGASVSWTATAAAGGIYTLDSFGAKNKQRELYKYIQDAIETMRDGRPDMSEFNLWCSKDVITRFADTNEWQFYPEQGGGYIQPAVRFGNVKGQSWRVVEDMDAPDNTLLILPKSDSWNNTAAVVGIYVPLMFVPNNDLFMDPANMNGKRAGITRQAIKVVDSARLGLVTIS